ncbi:MAG: TIGR02584 family CRISPR-associated protein [Acidobacteria bacterium]|nr:MAG: TIGR02584 family CRISPR-associated protein [Acidobacteriota bacterium]
MRRRRKTSESPYRHILVAVAGQTPQIITETLYALMVQRRPPVPISEIYILTTRRGAQIARHALLDAPTGQFFAFCREYDINPSSIAFDEQHIITLKRTGSGDRRSRRRRRAPAAEPLDDIRTVADNQALARQLLGFIKQLTSDPRTALHCSLAGGRKTMSAYMALALTLYGRRQDSLSHVLVPEEYESNPNFFFPTRRRKVIGILRNGQPAIADAKRARIELAEIPFIRLRDVLGRRFTQLDESVERTIQLAQHELDLTQTRPESLIIDLENRQVRFGDAFLPLTGIRLALYTYYAGIKLEHCVRPDLLVCGPCTDCFQTFHELDRARFLQIYRRTFHGSALNFGEQLARKRKKGKPILDVDNFHSYVSSLNRRIKEAGLPSSLNIIATGGYGSRRYGLALDKTRIQIIDASQDSDAERMTPES